MIELLDDSERFAREAGPLLESAVENTVLATVLDGIRHGHFADPPPRYALVISARDEVVAAALRTPPYPLLCTELSDGDATALMARWLAGDPGLPGVNAGAPTAHALAAGYRQATGGRSELRTAMALHAVERESLVEPRHPAAGALRPPAPRELELVRDWGRAFAVEAHLREDPEAASAATGRLIDDGRVYVWDHDGAPVSFVGHTSMVAGVPRIGPVYTPPERRSRGYGGSAVSAVSRRLFVAGARRIVLFTDLANSTSNKIYAELGYRQIGDFEEYGFTPPER